MHELLERLGRGDTRLIEMCQQANHAWREFLTELNGADTGTLAARLGFFQPAIERIFESKTLGQTMMPWSAFAVLYDTQNGWGPNRRAGAATRRGLRAQQLQPGNPRRGAIVRDLVRA